MKRTKTQDANGDESMMRHLANAGMYAAASLVYGGVALTFWEASFQSLVVHDLHTQFGLMLAASGVGLWSACGFSKALQSRYEVPLTKEPGNDQSGQ